jgi:hypothetical protein
MTADSYRNSSNPASLRFAARRAALGALVAFTAFAAGFAPLDARAQAAE